MVILELIVHNNNIDVFGHYLMIKGIIMVILELISYAQ